MAGEKELALAMKILDKLTVDVDLACSTMVTVRNRCPDQLQAERRGGAVEEKKPQEAGSQEYDGSAESDGEILEVNYSI